MAYLSARRFLERRIREIEHWLSFLGNPIDAFAQIPFYVADVFTGFANLLGDSFNLGDEDLLAGVSSVELCELLFPELRECDFDVVAQHRSEVDQITRGCWL